jgi:hypothetical protein
MKRFRESVRYGALTLALAATPAFAQTTPQPGTAPDTTMSDRAGTGNENPNYPMHDTGSRHSFGWLGLLGLVGLGGLMRGGRTDDRYTRTDDRPTMRP